MKRKLPVLIAIVLALVIALSACQYKYPPLIADERSQTPAAEVLPEPTESTVPVATEPVAQEPAPADPPAEESKYITLDEAINIALKDAGFQQADVKGLHAELERDDGITIYDVDFYKDNKEFDYEIDATTGKIRKPIKKESTTTTGSSASSSSSATKNITKDEAISKALSHAGLKKSEVSRLKAELDKDDGVSVYEIDFETPQWEYEYEINAKTGKIRKAEKDRND